MKMSLAFGTFLVVSILFERFPLGEWSVLVTVTMTLKKREEANVSQGRQAYK